MFILYAIFVSCIVYGQEQYVDSFTVAFSHAYSNDTYLKQSQTFNPVDSHTYYFAITPDFKLIYKTEDSKWKYFNTKGYDYTNKRTGEKIELPGIDMVSADGNRVLVKAKNSTMLYYALLVKEAHTDTIFHFINDPEPEKKITKEDVRQLVNKYKLAQKYAQKMGLGLFTYILKKRHKSKPFWWITMDKAKTWYKIEYEFKKQNCIISDVAVAYVSPLENDSLFPYTSGYSPVYGGDYHWPLFNKWYNKWMRKEIKGNRHYTTFIDGSVCYYILVKDTSDYIFDTIEKNTIKKYRFKVFFIDEQSYFSGSFRLIAPGNDPPRFSAQKEVLKTRKNLDYERHLPLKPHKYWWDPYGLYFKDCSIDGAVENIILTSRNKIYSINWTFWSMDFCWRARNTPDHTENLNARIDRDMHIIIPVDDAYGVNCYTQKLLPENNLLPEPNGTELHFLHEKEWKVK